MSMLKIRFVFLLIFYSQVCFLTKADEPFFTKTETLYSVKNGNPIGDLLFGIEVKSLDANPKELYLIIGDKNNNLIGSGENKKTLWIFNRNTNASDLKKDLKDKDYPIEIKDINEFVPFCENGIRFDLKDREEIKRQAKIPFYVNTSSKDKITLRLHFYIASKTKKKTIIEDEARIRLDFTVPAGKKEKKQEEDLISLTEKAGNRYVEKTQEQIEDSLRQVKEKERIQLTDLANGFIVEKNGEIASLLNEVNRLSPVKDAEQTKSVIDSLESLLIELRQKVNYGETTYADILHSDKAIQERFAKFSADHIIASKKLEGLKSELNEKSNWLIPVGIGFGILMLGGMFFMQIWNMAKMKRQVRKQQKMMEEEERKRAFESIDINDLDKI